MSNSTRTFYIITTLLGAVPEALGQASPNDRVVKFCKDHVGEKVGGGQCSHLAEEALKHAKAKPRSTFKEFPNAGDYVWGKLVYTLEIKDNSPKETKVPQISIQPGDIVQLRHATFKGEKLRGFENYDASYPQHTAVVLAVSKEGNLVTVLEQNINGKMVVLETPYRLTDLKTGWLRIYRPVSK
jgi:hypothetical protein